MVAELTIVAVVVHYQVLYKLHTPRKYLFYVAFSSVVTLTGYVNFTDSILGNSFYPKKSASTANAVYLATTHPEFISSLDIIMDSTVFFVNLTSSSHGGAIHMDNGVIKINVDAKASVIFTYIKASVQGVVHGGAVHIYNGALKISTNASVHFSHNSAFRGGAILTYNATIIIVGKDAEILFYNNTATEGGAVYLVYSTMHIYAHGLVQFIMNTAVQGGTVFIYSHRSNCSAIIVNNFAALFLTLLTILPFKEVLSISFHHHL